MLAIAIREANDTTAHLDDCFIGRRTDTQVCGVSGVGGILVSANHTRYQESMENSQVYAIKQHKENNSHAWKFSCTSTLKLCSWRFIDCNIKLTGADVACLSAVCSQLLCKLS